jgi:hypothetical protein
LRKRKLEWWRKAVEDETKNRIWIDDKSRK